MESLKNQVRRIEEQLQDKGYDIDHFSYHNLYNPGKPTKKVVGTLEEVISGCKEKGYKSKQGNLLIAAVSRLTVNKNQEEPVLVPFATISLQEENSVKLLDVGLGRSPYGCRPDASIFLNLHHSNAIPSIKQLSDVISMVLPHSDPAGLKRNNIWDEDFSFTQSLGKLPLSDIAREISKIETALITAGYEPPFRSGDRKGNLLGIILQDVSIAKNQQRKYSDNLYELTIDRPTKNRAGTIKHHLSLSHNDAGHISLERVVTRQFHKDTSYLTLIVSPGNLQYLPECKKTVAAVNSILKMTHKVKKGARL